MHCKSLTTLVLVFVLVISCLPVVISSNSVSNRIIYVGDNGAIGSGMFNGNIDIEYDTSDISDVIRPETELIRINTYVYYWVSGLGAKYIIPLFKDATVPIKLSIAETPEWLQASIQPEIVYPNIGYEKSDEPEQAILSISCTSSAPGFLTYSINIKAESDSIPGRFGLFTIIRSAKNEVPVQIKAGFYGNIQYEYQRNVELNVSEKVKIPIKIISGSNARARVTFEIIEIPEGWSPSINSEFFLGTTALGEDATGTVNFMIQAPKTIKEDYETVEFKIRTTSMAAGHPEIPPDNSTVLNIRATCYMDVEDRISANYDLIIAIIIICIFLFVIFWKRKKIKSLLFH